MNTLWLKKCFQSGLLKSEKAAWTNAIQIVKNSNFETELSCLLWEIFYHNVSFYLKFGFFSQNEKNAPTFSELIPA